MLKRLLDLGEADAITRLQPMLQYGWIVAAILLAAGFAFAIFLYRRESLIGRPLRILLAVCQAVALSLFVLLLLKPVFRLEYTQPFRRSVLVLVDKSASMDIRDQRQDNQSVREAAVAMGKLDGSTNDVAAKIEKLRPEVATASRLDLARSLLANKNIGLFGKLREFHEVNCFTFDSELKPVEGKTDQEVAKAMVNVLADGKATGIGAAIREAVSRYSGQPIAGVVVLSDFAWNKGEDPSEVAAAMRQAGVPIFPVPVGMPAPPDIRVQSIVAPEVALVEDRIPVLVQVSANGFKNEAAELVLRANGEVKDSRTITIRDGPWFEDLVYKPGKKGGPVTLEASLRALPGEISEENNKLTHNMRILDEKIKVLYVEGMPRWEYRYLRWVLLRDKRLSVKFLMTQGDPNLAEYSPLYISAYPEDEKVAFDHDLVILGDVSSKYFRQKQLEMMQKLVKERGGSLLMIAGPAAAPATYIDTPIEQMLPVKPTSGNWVSVPDNVHAVVTDDGYLSNIPLVTLPRERNDAIWKKVSSLDSLPQLSGAKPGAMVLATLSSSAGDNDDPYPLVAWQRYGNGKCMYVGTEDLWRMRLGKGDRYHSRFWSQAIEFLALSRLMGANKQVTIETDHRSYGNGQNVRVFANVLNMGFEPRQHPSYSVFVEHEGPSKEEFEVELQPVPNVPGLYEGMYLSGEPGRYRVKATEQDRPVANQAEFLVEDVPVEMRETALQTALLGRIADVSGGKVFRLDEVDKLPGHLGKTIPLRTIRTDKDVWDMPAAFLLLLLAAAMEWYFRRRENLV